MHKCRLYIYDAENRLIAPAMVISADNGNAATEEAEKTLDGVRAELRDGDRLIRLPRKEESQRRCDARERRPAGANGEKSLRLVLAS